jgi:Predicted hydrolase (metallo-beta-lactamase superfamily)
MIVDPTKWFRNRGAREVIHILPSGETPSDGENEEERLGPTGDLEGGALRLVGAHRADANMRNKFPDIDGESSVLPAGRKLVVAGPQGIGVFWEIVPFWKSPADLKAFMADVKTKLQIKHGKRSTFLKRVVDALKDKRKRRCLADLYEYHAKDRNRSSMCIYSGPSSRSKAPRCSDGMLFLGEERYRHIHSPAWLSTGDAPLKELAYGRAFEQFYRSRFGEISVFVLPHHGSGHNFPTTMMNQLRPDVWLAPSGHNSYHHPTPWLRSWASRRGTFWRVSHQERTGMFMAASVEP